MYLIPLDQIIYFNVTQLDTTTLSTIILISFAYHPSFPNLLYLFYGSTSIASIGQLYGSFYILVRDTDTGSFVQNSSISQPFHCLIKCEIKVTESLLLIESEQYIAIYGLDSSQHVSTSPITQKPKQNLTIFSDIYRHADINGNRYVTVNNTYLTFGQYSGSARTLSETNIQLRFNPINTLFVGLSGGQIFYVVNSTHISFVIYSCVACIINGSMGNNNIINNTNSLVVNTNISTFQSFKLYQGNTANDSGMVNARIYWGFADGRSYKFLINSTAYQLAEIYYNVTQQKSTANHELLVLYGSDYNINFRSFDYVSAADEYTLYSYSGYMSGVMAKVAISSDSTMFACRTYSDSWNIHQFMIVDNCSGYHAEFSNISSLFCECFQYDSDNKCSLVFSSSSKSSPPITMILCAIVGIALTVVSVIIIKKNYKRCTKGRKRTPYVYNPTQLMSFQI